MVAPVKIHISETESLSLHEFCTMQAEHFTKLHSGLPLFYTSNGILDLIHACTGDGELKEPMIEEELMVAREICKLLDRSREIEEYANAMTREADVEKAEMEQHHALVEVVPIVAIPESEGQQEAPMAQETQLTVLPGKEIGSLDRAIVDAALNSRLDNSYSDLSKTFVFGPDLTSVSLRDGMQPSPVEFGRLLGMGNDMGRKSLWLLGEACNFLMVLGHEDAVHVISDEFGFSYSHASNWARVVQRISSDKRVGLLPTVAAELALAEYSSDPKENQEILDKALEQAKEEKWNCQQARSHSRMLRGKDDPIDDGTKETPKQKIAKLEADNQRMKAVIERWLYEDGLDTEEPDWITLFAESIGVDPDTLTDPAIQTVAV